MAGENIGQKTSSVQSISRAADILTCISNGANSITDIAARCQLSKSTAHRLLQALIESNMVTQDPVKRQYYLGYLITHLMARPETTHEYLVACAREEIKQLADFSGETISLGLMVALRYVHLYSVPSKYDLRVVEEPRKAGTIYAGAAGRVLLSQLNKREFKTAMKCLNLLPVTQYTTVDSEKLSEQIQLVKRQGYAITSNERNVGAMCIAAPVKNYLLPTVLYILGPESRMKPRLTEFAENVLNRANRISYHVSQVFENNKKDWTV